MGIAGNVSQLKSLFLCSKKRRKKDYKRKCFSYLNKFMGEVFVGATILFKI